MTIRLTDLLQEGKQEKAAEELLSNLVKKSPFKGKVHIAGGYVRDELMGLDPKDIDLVIEMPDGGIKFAEWVTKKLGIYRKGSNPVIFPKFGTAKFDLRGVMHKSVDLTGIEVECVMTRQEKYTRGSRKPMVSAGSLKDDAERRDFTVNSMMKDLTTGEILDLTGMGKSDLKKGIVRTALDPNIIFQEDPLRMLRAVRFTMKYNWKLPMFMIRALKKNATQIKNISMERVQEELNKMFKTDSPHRAIKLIQNVGIGQYIFKGLKVNNDTYKYLANSEKDIAVRLSALMYNASPELAEKLTRDLKYENEIVRKVVAAVSNKDIIQTTDSELRNFMFTNKNAKYIDTILGLLDAMKLNTSGLKSRIKSLSKMKGKPPIQGKDLIKMGMKQGPEMGKVLKGLQDLYNQNPSRPESDYLDFVKDNL
jgi:poly(A) polymerase